MDMWICASTSVPKADTSDICSLFLHGMVQVNQFCPQTPTPQVAGIEMVTEMCKQEKAHELGYF